MDKQRGQRREEDDDGDGGGGDEDGVLEEAEQVSLRRSPCGQAVQPPGAPSAHRTCLSRAHGADPPGASPAAVPPTLVHLAG